MQQLRLWLCGDDSCSPICSFQTLNLLVVSACVYACSSCVCVFLLGEDSSSQDSSIAALHLLVVLAFSFCFQPFVLRFQPFALPFLRVACSISRRQRSCVKGMWKDCKGKKEPICFQARKIEAQASSLIQAESVIALESADLVKERQESSIDFSRDDVRDAVVAECLEYQFGSAAAFGTCRSQPEKLEAVQCGRNIQFFVKGVRGVQTQVVRGGSHVAFGPGCWGHGNGCVCHGWREDCGPLVILGKSWYHVELHCILLLPASWWVW